MRRVCCSRALNQTSPARRGLALFSVRESTLVLMVIAGFLFAIDRMHTALNFSHAGGSGFAPTVHNLLVDDATGELWIVRRAAGISRCKLPALDEEECSPFPEELSACAISACDSPRVLACSRLDGTVEVRIDGRRVAELPADQSVRGLGSSQTPMVAVTPDGSTIIAAEANGVINRWTQTAGKLQHDVQMLDGPIERLDLHHSGRLLAVISDRLQIRIWNLERQEWTREWKHGHPFCSGTAWSDDGARFATVGNDALLSVWDVAAGTLLWKQKADMMDPIGVEFSPSGQFLVTGGFEKQVRLWDAARGTLVWEHAGHSGPPRAFAWSADSRHVYSSGLDGQVRAWDLPASELSEDAR